MPVLLDENLIFEIDGRVLTLLYVGLCEEVPKDFYSFSLKKFNAYNERTFNKIISIAVPRMNDDILLKTGLAMSYRWFQFFFFV